MNTYRIKETVDSVYDFVDADWYWVDDNNHLQFYNNDKEGEEIAVATFNPWVSVVMMDKMVVTEDE